MEVEFEYVLMSCLVSVVETIVSVMRCYITFGLVTLATHLSKFTGHAADWPDMD